MQLDFAFLCNFGGYLQDHRPVVIGAGVDVIEAREFPFSAPEMSLMARVLAMPDEPDKEHTFRVELTQPTGETAVVGREQQFNVARDRRDASAPAGCMLKADLRVEYPRPGVYRFRVLLDGQEQKEIALRIFAARPEIAPTMELDNLHDEKDEWAELERRALSSERLDAIAEFLRSTGQVRPDT